MIRTAPYGPVSGDKTMGGLELLDAWNQAPESTVWVDFFDEPPENEQKSIETYFGLYPLAISDARRSRHPPKFEVFQGHSFPLLEGLDAGTRDVRFGTIQIAIFIGERFLVTRHAEESPSADRIWSQDEADPHLLSEGPDAVAVLRRSDGPDRRHDHVRSVPMGMAWQEFN